MRKDFKTFSPGDKVLANSAHPYYNKLWLDEGRVYTVAKMLEIAGVVTLVGYPYNKTFPDEIFILVEKADETDSQNATSPVE